MSEFKIGDKVIVYAAATGLGIDQIGYVSKVQPLFGCILITVDYIKPDQYVGNGCCVNACHVKKYKEPEMNEIEKNKALNLISEISKRVLEERSLSLNINQRDKKIKSLKKERNKLINKKDSISERLKELRSEFYLIEGDKTCYGCTNDNCSIHHQMFSSRCDKYTDLPF